MKTKVCLALAGLLAAGAAALPAHAATRVQYAFTLAPGASKSFPIPVIGMPVTLSGTISGQNGGTQTPSALVGALVNQDQKSGQVTWIGTNGNGTVTVGTTLSSHVVVSYAFGNAVITATPATFVGGRSTLTVTQSATQTSVSDAYTITLTY
jgi:hypothetical protein